MLVRCKRIAKVVGLTAAAFGVGVMVGFVVPPPVLAWCEAVALVGVGTLCILRK